MAKKRKYKKRAKRRSTRRLGAPRRMRLITGKTTKALMDGAMVGGTAVGSTFLLNKIPWVKDQAGWMKALFQAGMGVTALTLFKNEWVKKFGAGSIAGAAISMIIPFMPEGFKFAGGRSFSEGELEELRTLGIPMDIVPEATMGIPEKIGNAFSEYRPKMQSNYNY